MTSIPIEINRELAWANQASRALAAHLITEHLTSSPRLQLGLSNPRVTVTRRVKQKWAMVFGRSVSKARRLFDGQGPPGRVLI